MDISNKNRCAFLDMLAFAEGTSNSPTTLDNGYDQIVGRTRFKNYSDHPRKLVTLLNRQGKPIINKASGKILKSAAAGRYQLLARYWTLYKVLLRLQDFSPASQDAVALQQIKERGALPDIDAGKTLRLAYENAGGTFA